MLGLKLDLENTGIDEKEIQKYAKKVSDIHGKLHEEKDDENEFLGWLELPTKYNKREFKKIKETEVKNGSKLYISSFWWAYNKREKS